MHKYLVVVILLLLFQSCRTPRPAVAEQSIVKDSTTRDYEVKEVETLKPHVIRPDSAMIVALLRCDSTNKVVMAELSQRGTAGTGVDVALRNGTLTANFTVKHDPVWTKEKSRSEKLKITYTLRARSFIRNTVTVKVNELHWWQKWLMWIGGISLVIVAIRITYVVGKRQFKLTI